MTEPLDPIAETYRDALRRMRALDARIDDETFNAKPSPTSWSVGECVVHLNTIAKGYLPLFEGALEDAPNGSGPYKWGWVSRRFIEAVRPGSRPIPTAGAMRPPATEGATSSIDRARAMARFEDDMDRYLAVLERADGLDVSRVRVASPFLRILRLPVGAFLEAMGLHAQRHVGQAERAAAAG